MSKMNISFLLFKLQRIDEQQKLDLWESEIFIKRMSKYCRKQISRWKDFKRQLKNILWCMP